MGGVVSMIVQFQRLFQALDKHGLIVANMDHRDNDIRVQLFIYMRDMFVWEEDMATMVMRVVCLRFGWV